MEELLPFIFFVIYIIISIISGGNKRKKKKRAAQPPVVVQQPQSQTKPVQQKPTTKPVKRRPKANKSAQSVPNRRPRVQPQPVPKTNKPVRRKNPFEVTLEDMLKELQVEEPKVNKPKAKPKLFDDKSKEKVKPLTSTASKVITKPKRIKQAKIQRKKRVNIKNKVKSFNFNALDAVIYNEILNRKY